MVSYINVYSEPCHISRVGPFAKNAWNALTIRKNLASWMFNRVQNKSLYSRPFLTDIGFGIPLEKEAVVRRCSLKKVVLGNFAKFTGKHLHQNLLFSKVAGLIPETLFSCEFCKTFQNTCFYWTLPVATAVNKNMKYDEITKENVMIYDLWR